MAARLFPFAPIEAAQGRDLCQIHDSNLFDSPIADGFADGDALGPS